MTGLRVTILCLLIGLSGALRASRTFPVGWVAVADTSETVVVKDSVVAQSDTPTAEVAEPVDTARLMAFTDSVAKQVPPLRRTANFIPNPKRALWLSLVFPGAGQIYNRKFWKLPFIYGGFLGCTYALMWNQQMYRDFGIAT